MTDTELTVSPTDTLKTPVSDLNVAPPDQGLTPTLPTPDTIAMQTQPPPEVQPVNGNTPDTLPQPPASTSSDIVGPATAALANSDTDASKAQIHQILENIAQNAGRIGERLIVKPAYDELLKSNDLDQQGLGHELKVMSLQKVLGQEQNDKKREKQLTLLQDAQSKRAEFFQNNPTISPVMPGFIDFVVDLAVPNIDNQPPDKQNKIKEPIGQNPLQYFENIVNESLNDGAKKEELVSKIMDVLNKIDDPDKKNLALQALGGFSKMMGDATEVKKFRERARKFSTIGILLLLISYMLVSNLGQDSRGRQG